MIKGIQHCRSCNAEILFVETAKGHMMPVNYKPEFENDKEYDKTKHISHFSTCPEADKFRKKKK